MIPAVAFARHWLQAWSRRAAASCRCVVCLWDPEMVALLDKVKPLRRWEPALLETDGQATRVLTGARMRLRLLQVLGPYRSLLVVSSLWSLGGRVSGRSRREFLVQSSKLAVGLLGLAGMPGAAFARNNRQIPDLEPLRGEDARSIIHAAAASSDVGELSKELDRKLGWAWRVSKAFSIRFGKQHVRCAVLSDPKTRAIIVYPAGKKPLAMYWRADGERVVLVFKDGRVQQVPDSHLRSTHADYSALWKGHWQSNSQSLQPMDCCISCRQCLAGDLLCVLFAACCFGGFAFCCPVGLGQCASAAAICSGASGCDCASCF